VVQPHAVADDLCGAARSARGALPVFLPVCFPEPPPA
jgi:hypothetical protein